MHHFNTGVFWGTLGGYGELVKKQLCGLELLAVFLFKTALKSLGMLSCFVLRRWPVVLCCCFWGLMNLISEATFLRLD